MSSFSDELQAIESRFKTQWDAGSYSAIPVSYENVDFNPPNNALYVAVFVRPGNAEQVSLGSGTQWSRYFGVIIISVFVPANKQRATAHDLANAAANVFHRAQFSTGVSGTITCRVPYETVVGTSGGRFQIDVTCPFKRDKLE